MSDFSNLKPNQQKRWGLLPMQLPQRPGWMAQPALTVAAPAASAPSLQPRPHVPSRYWAATRKVCDWRTDAQSSFHENVTQRKWRVFWTSRTTAAFLESHRPIPQQRHHRVAATSTAWGVFGRWDQIPAKPFDSDAGPVTRSLELVRRCSKYTVIVNPQGTVRS